MNDVWNNWSKHKFFLWKQQKTVLTFEQNDGGTIHTFQNTLTNERCTEQLERAQILPHTKCMGHTANITKIASTFECSDGETIYT